MPSAHTFHTAGGGKVAVALAWATVAAVAASISAAGGPGAPPPHCCSDTCRRLEPCTRPSHASRPGVTARALDSDSVCSVAGRRPMRAVTSESFRPSGPPHRARLLNVHLWYLLEAVVDGNVPKPTPPVPCPAPSPAAPLASDSSPASSSPLPAPELSMGTGSAASVPTISTNRAWCGLGGPCRLSAASEGASSGEGGAAVACAAGAGDGCATEDCAVE